MEAAVKVNKKKVIHKEEGSKFRISLKKNKYMYLLILPAVLFVIVFHYLAFSGLAIVFKEYDVLKGFAASRWVGLENFKTILNSPNFLLAIRNTLVYSSVTVFGSFPFPIILALMLNEIKSKPFKRITQTVSYLPYFLSWISVVGLFLSFFALDGPFNQLMSALFGEGYEKKNIFFESKYFLGVLFSSGLWKNVGWSSIIYLAAISGIDPTLYEASTMDGCGKLRQVWYITLPGISGTMLILLVMNLGSLVNMNFEQVYGFQNVYIQEQTEVINTLIYRQGIMGGKYSLATAFGIMQGLVSVTLVFLANQISKKAFHVSIW